MALRRLQEGETHPQLIVLAAVVRQAGRDHQETLRREMLPVAGNA